MREITAPFEILYQEHLVRVTEADIKDRRVFYIQFTNGNKPLTITVADDRREVKFWTSIPQGRQTEAEEIGRLIATYIRNKNKK